MQTPSDMAGWYVRIPIGSHIGFPDRCPFTGRMRPTKSVALHHSEKKVLLLLPLKEHFRRRPTAPLQFPASASKAYVARILGVLPWISIIGGVGLMYHYRGVWEGFYFLCGGLVFGMLSRFLHWFWLRQVRIVSVGRSSLEVRFSSGDFAKEFSRLNELVCSSERIRKKGRPVNATSSA